MTYLLAFDDSTVSEAVSVAQAKNTLVPRLSEALTIPVLDSWQEPLWEVGQAEGLVGELLVGGDCREGYFVQLSESGWKEVIISLFKEYKIRITSD